MARIHAIFSFPHKIVTACTTATDGQQKSRIAVPNNRSTAGASSYVSLGGGRNDFVAACKLLITDSRPRVTRYYHWAITRRARQPFTRPFSFTLHFLETVFPNRCSSSLFVNANLCIYMYICACRNSSNSFVDLSLIFPQQTFYTFNTRTLSTRSRVFVTLKLES